MTLFIKVRTEFLESFKSQSIEKEMEGEKGH